MATTPPPSTDEIKLAPVTLRFADSTLEHEFQLDSASKLRFRHRVTWFVSAALWGVLSLLDPITAGSPANLEVILVVRAVVFPFFAGAALVGWLPLERFARLRHVAAAIAASVGLWAVLVMGLAVPEPAALDMSSGPLSFAVGVMAACFIWSTRLAVSFVIAIPITLAMPLLLMRFAYDEVLPTYLWMCLAAILGGVGSWRFEVAQRYAFMQRRWLASEKARSESLLHDLLPQAIAERLKRGAGRIAEHHDQATVLFCDIVGFTKLSESTPPATLVETLDAIFSEFDDAAERLGLEKIKTIGDAYMVAGGLPSPRPDHAEAVAEMALSIREMIGKYELGGHSLEVRVGIHTGPVIAGVIGKRKLVYDLWGDTVNTASRMESHGEVGRIQVSEATHAFLEGKYECVFRGEVEVKGKGRMPVWFLEGRVEAGR